MYRCALMALALAWSAASPAHIVIDKQVTLGDDMIQSQFSNQNVIGRFLRADVASGLTIGAGETFDVTLRFGPGQRLALFDRTDRNQNDNLGLLASWSDQLSRTFLYDIELLGLSGEYRALNPSDQISTRSYPVFMDPFSSNRNLTNSEFSFSGLRITGRLSANDPGISQASFRFQISGDDLRIDTKAPPPVPEPASWAMMIAGFAMAGAAARRRVGTVGYA